MGGTEVVEQEEDGLVIEGTDRTDAIRPAWEVLESKRRAMSVIREAEVGWLECRDGPPRPRVGWYAQATSTGSVVSGRHSPDR